MPISKPLLPPKRGYVEVEVDGERTYRKIEPEQEPEHKLEPTDTDVLNALLGVIE